MWGGGSNAAGIFYPFLNDEDVKIICVEAAGKGVNTGKSAATSILGKEGIIHGSKTLLMQTNDGQITEPYSISAGLDYPGIGPMHANLYKSGRGEFISVTDKKAMEWDCYFHKWKELYQLLKQHMHLPFWIKKNSRRMISLYLTAQVRGDKDLDTFLLNISNYETSDITYISV